MPGRRDSRRRAAPRSAPPPRALALSVAALAGGALVVATLLAGCGGSGDTAGGGATPRAGAGTAASSPPHEIGPRGERIDEEAAGTLHLSPADCTALRRRAEAQSDRRLAVHGEPTPPSSRCRLTAPGVTIGVYLDNGHAAHQRYLNRMVEQNQFGAPDPGRVTHPIAGVGDPAPGNQNASWVPDLSTLFAARGNRWLTVAYAVAGVSSAQALQRAKALARLGFRLSAR